jgi:tetratricopeptide (TPR) repeat protein
VHSEFGRGREATREEYLAEAAALLGRGRYAPAALQLAAALTFDPQAEDSLRLTERWLTDTPKPLSVLPADGEIFFGLVALRALAFARARQLGRAVVLLMKVGVFQPSVPFLGWAKAWVGGDPLLRGVPRDAVLALGAKLVSAIPDDDLRPGIAQTIEGAVAILDALDRRSSQPPSDAAVLASFLLRKGSGFEEAVARLGASRCSRDVRYEAALAAALRDVGDRAGALAALLRAVECDPSSVETSLDLVESLMDEGRFEEAAQRAADPSLRSVESAGVRAKTLALYARTLADEDAAARASAEDGLAGRGDALARALVRDLRLGRTELPGLFDPVAALIRSFGDRPPGGAGRVRVRVDLDGPLPAGARAAFVAALAKHEREGELLTTTGAPSGAPSAPDDRLAAQVEEIARQVDVDRWCRDSPHLGRRALEALVTSPPIRWACWLPDPVEAVHLCLVAALAASTSDGTDRLSLVREAATGEDTWLSAAGLTVLGAVARTQPEVAESVLEAVRAVEPRLGEDDARTLPLYLVWSRVVAAPADERSRAHRLRRAREVQLTRRAQRRDGGP